jgi:hypothetical protein
MPEKLSDDGEYGLLKYKAKEFFKDFIKIEKEKAVVIVQGMDTWRHSDRIAQQIMLGIGEMYYTQHSRRKMKYLEASYEITANSLKPNAIGAEDSAMASPAGGGLRGRRRTSPTVAGTSQVFGVRHPGAYPF